MIDPIWMIKRKVVMDRDRHVCQYCGSIEELTVDHIWPKKKGGSDNISNLITACKNCNLSKGGKSLREWMTAFVQTTVIKKERSYDTSYPEKSIESKIGSTPLGINVKKLSLFAEALLKEPRLGYSRFTGSGRLFSKQEYEKLLVNLFEAGYIRTINPRGSTQGGFCFIEDGIEKLCALAKIEYVPFFNQEAVIQKAHQSPPKLRDVVSRSIEKKENEKIQEEDTLFQSALEIVKSGHPSATYLQSHLGIGYPKAARFISKFEEMGIVGPSKDGKPRDLLIHKTIV